MHAPIRLCRIRAHGGLVPDILLSGAGSFLNRGDVSMPETVVHFQIRMPPVLHEQLASWAKEDKASLNALIVGILEKAIEQHEKSGHKE
jgi:hypothetical protein